MKAEELMIGDWVKFPNGIEKIIDLPYIEGRGICASFAASATLFPVEIDELEPVPLTPEILEKNGFKKQEFDEWECGYREDEGQIFEILWRCDYSDCTHLTITNYQANFGSFKSFNIDYVHELQHALKLCGINKEIML